MEDKGVANVYTNSYPNTFVFPESGKVHMSLSPNLVDDYLDLLKETPLKEALNEGSKKVPYGAGDLLYKECLERVQLRDQSFMNSTKRSLDLSLGKLKKQACYHTKCKVWVIHQGLCLWTPNML